MSSIRGPPRGPRGRRYCVALSILRDEVFDTVDDRETELPDPTHPVLDATTEDEPAVIPGEPRERVPEDASELDEIEARAFARLLDDAME